MKMVGLAKLQQRLYQLVTQENSSLTPHLSSINHISLSTINNNNLWHFCLGHLSDKRLNVLHEQFPFISNYSNESCDVCHLAKQKHLYYSISGSRASKIFDFIHMDIWGPFSKVSIHGHKYFLTIVDNFSRFTWVVLLKTKAEVQINVQNFIALVETQFDSKVKILRSDNGLEFSLKNFYASKGIIHQTSCPYTP